MRSTAVASGRTASLGRTPRGVHEAANGENGRPRGPAPPRGDASMADAGAPPERSRRTPARGRPGRPRGRDRRGTVDVRDPAGGFKPQAFLRTGPNAASDTPAWFVRRWSAGTTSEDERRGTSTGVTSASMRSGGGPPWPSRAPRPCRSASNPLVAPWTHDPDRAGRPLPRSAAWRAEGRATAGDALAAGRRNPRTEAVSHASRRRRNLARAPGRRSTDEARLLRRVDTKPKADADRETLCSVFVSYTAGRM